MTDPKKKKKKSKSKCQLPRHTLKPVHSAGIRKPYFDLNRLLKMTSEMK